MNTVVLVIDARPGPLGETRGVLENAGYRVVTAEDARSGLSAFERISPGIVVVDSKLPGSPSAALCRQLRSIERQKGARVTLIMLRRGGGRKSRRTADEASGLCDAVLRQPVDDAVLLSTLHGFAPPVSVRVEEVDLPAMPGNGGGGLEREIDLQLDQLISGEASTVVRGEEDLLLDEVVEELLREESAGGIARRDSDVRGTLASLELSEIVQMLALGGKTARVSLRNESERGEVWFDNGVVTHAARGSELGERAFFDMLGWRSGDFAIHHGLRCENRSLNQDAMYLVLEGMRQMDEASRRRTVSLSSATAAEIEAHGRDRDRSPADAVERRAACPDHHWVSNTEVLPLARPRPGPRKPTARPEPRAARSSTPWRGILLTAVFLGAAVTAWALILG